MFNLRAALMVAILMGLPLGRVKADEHLSSNLRIRISNKSGSELVQQALEGAQHRLESPGCARVLTDFEVGNGRRLEDNLTTLGMNASEYIGLLLFVDGSNDMRCVGHHDVIAWTSPGSRVVRLCMPRFRQKKHDDPALTEVLIIHEVLHTLGLGENPPSTREITARVLARCSHDRLSATAAGEARSD